MRTALRLAVVEALNADPVIAALCAGRVFDSRIGEIDSTEAVPMLIVSTEDDRGEAWSANNGGPPFNEICDLLITITMRAIVPQTDDEPEMMGTAQTDRELEAYIDLLETRVVEAITVADTDASRVVRQLVTRRVTHFKSGRFNTDESAAKLAERNLALTVELKGGGEDDPLAPPTGPFASLPDPLRSVCESMPADSSGLETCTMLAAAITTPAALSRFTGIDITAAPRPAIDPAAPPTTSDPVPDVFITANTAPS